AWDALEDILKRHLSETPIISQRSRMATAGRDILRWLAEPYILSTVRIDFETFLEDIVDACDDWLTSAESLGLQRTTGPALVTQAGKVVPLRGRRAYGSGPAAPAAALAGLGRPPAPPAPRARQAFSLPTERRG